MRRLPFADGNFKLRIFCKVARNLLSHFHLLGRNRRQAMHWAPNGFSCHCRITSVTRREGEASDQAGLTDLFD
jgi:hypothetical protein